MSTETHELTLRGVTLPNENGKPDVEVQAYVLGYASSQHDVHDENAHGPDETAPKRVRCSACRWFEVQIFDVSDDDEAGTTYLVYTVGKTIVPGETDRIRFVWTDSPYEVVECLTVRQGGMPKLPVASGRAISQAAYWDEDVAVAYRDRAVA